MSDQSPSPAPLSDDELRETLEMIGTVVASVSDRVDAQTSSMDRLVKTATEARQAAFAAQNQTDPEHYGDLVGATIDGRITDTLRRLTYVANTLDQKSGETSKVLDQLSKDKWEILREVRDREEKAARLKRLLPWFGLGALVLALALAVLLPRFSAINGSTCAVFGGQWLSTSTSGFACVHYQD